MKCRVCKNEFEPSQYQIKKCDWICRPCERLKQKEWRLKRKNEGRPVVSTKMPPEYHKEYGSVYNKLPEVMARKAAQMRTYRNDPELRHKHIARWMTNHAIASGKLIKGDCAVCGSPKTEAHHEDYYKPLDVIWLCRSCHTKHHAKATGA